MVKKKDELKTQLADRREELQNIKLFDRPAISLRSVAIALGVVVLTQPESVATPSTRLICASGESTTWPRSTSSPACNVTGKESGTNPSGETSSR